MALKLRLNVYSSLKDEPHFGPNIKRLTDWQPPTWRYRIGDWCFFYQIDEKEKIVFMTAAAHRSDAYR
jgi:mRNA interferase RelE/StbE